MLQAQPPSITLELVATWYSGNIQTGTYQGHKLLPGNCRWYLLDVHVCGMRQTAHGHCKTRKEGRDKCSEHSYSHVIGTNGRLARTLNHATLNCRHVHYLKYIGYKPSNRNACSVHARQVVKCIR